ncbi:MAG: aryl-sulfate sulfotransferase [Promethearchaeota archaeon]
MNRKSLVGLLFCVMFLASFAVGLVQVRSIEFPDGYATIHDVDKAFDGLNIFLEKGTNKGAFVVDMEGNLISSSAIGDGHIDFMNSTTVVITTGRAGYIWNMIDNNLVNLSFGSHHDLEYNPFTDTFLILKGVREGSCENPDGITMPIEYDDILEVDREGNVVWEWDMSEHIPFDLMEHSLRWEVKGKGENQAHDWSHANAVFWDIDKNMIYLNTRNLDTFYKIDKLTGDIVWACGRYNGDFTLLDKDGDEVESLWYHSHGLEKMSENHFIQFDNDIYNSNTVSPWDGNSSLLEIEVDEENMVAREVWRWIAPIEYFADRFGDANRMPNGNTLGCFGVPPSHLTEVTSEGEIVWEMLLSDYQVYRVERFLTKPLAEIVPTGSFTQGSPIVLTFNVLDTIKRSYLTGGVLTIIEDDLVLKEMTFQFSPYWQETELFVDIGELPLGRHNLKLTVENCDGISNSVDFTVYVSYSKTVWSEQVFVTMLSLGAIVGIAFATFAGYHLTKKYR